jgi:hypothetical protein
MKSMADLSCAVSDRNLILNVLWWLNQCYDNLRVVITCSMLFPSFHKVRDDWSWRNSRSALICPRLPHMHSTPTTPLPRLPLLHLIPLAMAVRVKERVMTVVAIARTTVDAMLPTKATRARVACPTLPCLLGPPYTILGSGQSTCTLVRLKGGGGGSSNTAFCSSRLSSLRLDCPWSALHSHHPWRQSWFHHRCMPPSNSRPHLHPGRPGTACGTSSRWPTPST